MRYIACLALAACTAAPPSSNSAADTIVTSGLWPMKNGNIVYDSNLGVYWLANANLAYGQKLTDNINSSGSMDFVTAQNFVDALNRYDGGNGWLGITDWQLPTTPQNDPYCSVWMGPQYNSYGSGCLESAMGSLYKVGLGRNFPNSVYRVTDSLGNFQNLQPSLYWTSAKGGTPGGHATFSFNNGNPASNTDPNYLYVLPMRKHAIGATPTCTGFIHYPNDQVVYDCANDVTWLADANYAASQPFTFTGKSMNLPLIARDGAMSFATAAGDPTSSTLGWIDGMNGKLGTAAFLGQTDWQLPDDPALLMALYTGLGLTPNDSVLTTTETTGPFTNLQPYLYWSCERGPDPLNSTAPCLDQHAGMNAKNLPQDFSFNFGDGFEGTTDDDKPLYVMVYHPQKSALPSTKCFNAQTCCAQAGGSWDGQHCE